MSAGKAVPSADLALVRRAGRIVAIQAAVGLAALLLLVGAVVAGAFLRTQSTQITDQLNTVAQRADDTDDPPPGMELAMRDGRGRISASDGGKVGIPLLSGPAGSTDVHDRDRHYRALVADRPEGRVVALVDLAPYQTSRNRLFVAIALAEFTGILASVVAVRLFTRRAVRPLTEALALQRRFVTDASHELRAPLTVLHTRAQLLAARLHSGNVDTAARDADALVADTRVLSDLVDDLLASATTTAGRTDGTRTDVGAIARSVCESMHPYAESVGVALDCAASGGLEVIGSEPALRRAVTALVDNALGHQSDGGRVRVSANRDGQQIIVSVIDDGLGVYRETEAGARIDPSGELTGVPFTNARQLGAVIAKDPAFSHCMTESVFSYAVGHRPAEGEEDVVDWLDARFAEEGFAMIPLLRQITLSDAFRFTSAVTP